MSEAPNTSEPLYVPFTEAQVRVIREVGAARQAAKTTEHKKAATTDGAHLHVMGYAAYVALCIALGVEPETDATPQGRGERPALRAFGATFAVQHNSRAGGDLRFDMPKANTVVRDGQGRMLRGGIPGVDFIVLTTGDLPVIEIAGYVTRRRAEAVAVERTLGSMGPRLLVERQHLLPLAAMVETLGRRIPPAVLARSRAYADGRSSYARHVASERAAERTSRKAPPAPPQADLFGGASRGLLAG